MPAREPSGATVTRVPVTTESTTLLAANTSRRGATIYNGTSADLDIKYGTGASATSRTVRVPSGWSHELPPTAVNASGEITGCYAGIITGALATGTGNVDVTEVA